MSLGGGHTTEIDRDEYFKASRDNRQPIFSSVCADRLIAAFWRFTFSEEFKDHLD